MKAIALITGAGTGIGKAVSRALLKRDITIFAVGRRLSVLEELKKENPENIFILATDVATSKGREKIIKALPPTYSLKYLIHNAAILTPVGPLSSITEEAWRYAMATNVEAPLFLTQALLPHMPGGRILHISSGAAHFPIIHWTAYCTSKTALYMIYQCLNLELKNSNVAISSIRPGIVETPMQETIRSFSREQFPDVARFKSYKAKDELLTVERVGEFISHLLLDIPAKKFSKKEWDMYEHIK